MTENEHLRRAILAELYRTRAIRVPSSYVQRASQRECGAEAAAVDAELAFLESAKLIDHEADSLGSSKYWKLTAAGVVQHERGQ